MTVTRYSKSIGHLTVTCGHMILTLSDEMSCLNVEHEVCREVCEIITLLSTVVPLTRVADLGGRLLSCLDLHHTATTGGVWGRLGEGGWEVGERGWEGGREGGGGERMGGRWGREAYHNINDQHTN